jgi:phosphatidylglycerol lysyltransferase
VRVDGRIVAFANLWLTENRSEASVALMHDCNDAPPGTMDVLFVQLMLSAKGREFERFSLGMAPLSGIDGQRVAPAWARLASVAPERGPFPVGAWTLVKVSTAPFVAGSTDYSIRHSIPAKR